MNILFSNDWHFAKQNPGSRIDDYNGELFDFLRQLLVLVRYFECGALVIAGDIFHNKGLAPWGVVTRLLEWGLDVRRSGCELLSIAGNHDEQHDRLESLPATPYGVLVGSSIFRDISRQVHKVEPNGPTIYGVPWPDGANPNVFKGIPAADIVVAHGFATPEGQERWGVYCHKYDDLALQAPNVKVWHFGHDHTDHGVMQLPNGAQVINIGALARGALDQDSITRQVKTAVLRMHEGSSWSDPRPQFTIDQITLKQKPAEQIFDIERYKSRKAEQRAMEEFLDGLSSGLEGVLDVDYQTVLNSMTLDTDVRARVQQYIERAEATV